MRIAVLAYHSQNVNGDTYDTNDHVALASDLDAVRRRNLPVIRLHDAIYAWIGGRARDLPETGIALTCDDGTTLDWEPFNHPLHGRQTPFREIVAQHACETNMFATGLLTSFVIASPTARSEIDANCYAGYPLSSERWWAAAQAEGTIMIENHSWDHLHPCVSVVAQSEQRKGDFTAISTWADADRQVRQSADYIDSMLLGTGHTTHLFAYPYGHISDFLAEDYLPNHQPEHRVRAAFADFSDYWTETSQRFRIPRFVCGKAWRTPQEFLRVLDDLG